MTPGPRRSDHQPSTTLQAQASGYWVGQFFAGDVAAACPITRALSWCICRAMYFKMKHPQPVRYTQHRPGPRAIGSLNCSVSDTTDTKARVQHTARTANRSLMYCGGSNHTAQPWVKAYCTHCTQVLDELQPVRHTAQARIQHTERAAQIGNDTPCTDTGLNQHHWVIHKAPTWSRGGRFLINCRGSKSMYSSSSTSVASAAACSTCVCVCVCARACVDQKRAWPLHDDRMEGSRLSLINICKEGSLMRGIARGNRRPLPALPNTCAAGGFCSGCSTNMVAEVAKVAALPQTAPEG
eukprot:1031950-Pelagomonas_calceolata.AAC.1